MAGYNVREYLRARDYDHFYTLFHAIAESIVSKCLNIRDYLRLIQHLRVREPDIFATDVAPSHLEEFTAFATEFGVAMNRFYFPYRTEDPHQNIVLSMDRWKPYDAAAWDDMLAQMIAILQPLVRSGWEHYERMTSHPLHKSPTAEHVQNLLLEIGRYLDDLSRWCNSEEIEYLLFRPPGYEAGLSPYGNI